MEETKETRREYKTFKGIYREQMPELIRAGFKPLTIAEIMRAKLTGELFFDELYDSASGIAYSKTGKFKIIPYSKELASITLETELHNGGIKLTQEQYDSIQAQEFSRNDMFLERILTQEQVLKHQGWLTLIGDKELLEQYTEKVIKQERDRFGENTSMSFAIANKQNVPNLRAFGLACLVEWSGTGDMHSLGNYGASLVGVRENLEADLLRK